MEPLLSSSIPSKIMELLVAHKNYNNRCPNKMMFYHIRTDIVQLHYCKSIAIIMLQNNIILQCLSNKTFNNNTVPPLSLLVNAYGRLWCQVPHKGPKVVALVWLANIASFHEQLLVAKGMDTHAHIPMYQRKQFQETRQLPGFLYTPHYTHKTHLFTK